LPESDGPIWIGPRFGPMGPIGVPKSDIIPNSEFVSEGRAMPSDVYSAFSFAIASALPSPSYLLPRYPPCSAAQAAPIKW
jgi:hypothetical protein